MKWEIKWKKTSEELPKESGYYLTLQEGYYDRVKTLTYSAKYKQFNRLDSWEEDKHIDVDYWAEMPEVKE